MSHSLFFFFFNDTATTEIYTLSLHDALPISFRTMSKYSDRRKFEFTFSVAGLEAFDGILGRSPATGPSRRDRKSTRLNSSHSQNSYAVFCLEKKNIKTQEYLTTHVDTNYKLH